MSEITPFVAAEAVELPPIVKSWGKDEILYHIEYEVAMCFWFLQNEKIPQQVAQETMENYPVFGATRADYRYKLIDVPGMGQVIAVISFRALGFEEPFIEVICKTFPFGSTDHLRQLAAALAPHFPAFKPQWMHVRLWGDPLPPADDLLCGYRLLAAPLGDLRRREKPPRYDQVKLKRARNLSHYNHYAAAYDTFHAENPQLISAVPKDPRDLQQLYMRRGEIYNAFVGKQWISLISVIQEVEFMALQGLEIADVIMAKEFRGRGYAAAVQRHLIDQLKAPDSTLLIGTIHPNNQPSLRTALRIGRVDVGGGYYIRIGGV